MITPLDVSDLCRRASTVASRFALPDATRLADIGAGEFRVGAGPAAFPIYELAIAPDLPAIELARIRVPASARGMGTCLYFALEDWARLQGAVQIQIGAKEEVAILAAKVGFDFYEESLPSDLELALRLPHGHSIRYPFEVINWRGVVAGADVLRDRGFDGKRVFDGNAILEQVASARRSTKCP